MKKILFSIVSIFCLTTQVFASSDNAINRQAANNTQSAHNWGDDLNKFHNLTSLEKLARRYNRIPQPTVESIIRKLGERHPYHRDKNNAIRVLRTILPFQRRSYESHHYPPSYPTFQYSASQYARTGGGTFGIKNILSLIWLGIHDEEQIRWNLNNAGQKNVDQRRISEEALEREINLICQLDSVLKGYSNSPLGEGWSCPNGFATRLIQTLNHAHQDVITFPTEFVERNTQEEARTLFENSTIQNIERRIQGIQTQIRTLLRDRLMPLGSRQQLPSAAQEILNRLPAYLRNLDAPVTAILDPTQITGVTQQVYIEFSEVDPIRPNDVRIRCEERMRTILHIPEAQIFTEGQREQRDTLVGIIIDLFPEEQIDNTPEAEATPAFNIDLFVFQLIEDNQHRGNIENIRNDLRFNLGLPENMSEAQRTELNNLLTSVIELLPEAPRTGYPQSRRTGRTINHRFAAISSLPNLDHLTRVTRNHLNRRTTEDRTAVRSTPYTPPHAATPPTDRTTVAYWQNHIHTYGTTLHLTNQNLGNPEIAALSQALRGNAHISSIDLSDNNISALPSNFLEGTNVRTLDLCNNNLHSLPNSITQGRTNVTYLSIHDNQFTECPSYLLRNVSAITTLYEWGNPFNWNKATIGYWQDKINRTAGSVLNLNFEYNLTNSGLSALSQALQDHTTITTLNLEGVGISTLPSNFLEGTNVQTLYLENNNLYSLPKSIKQGRTNVTYLSIHDNQFTQDPKKLLKNAPQITIVYSYNNPFTTFSKYKCRLIEAKRLLKAYKKTPNAKNKKALLNKLKVLKKLAKRKGQKKSLNNFRKKFDTAAFNHKLTVTRKALNTYKKHSTKKNEKAFNKHLKALKKLSKTKKQKKEHTKLQKALKTAIFNRKLTVTRKALNTYKKHSTKKNEKAFNKHLKALKKLSKTKKQKKEHTKLQKALKTAIFNHKLTVTRKALNAYKNHSTKKNEKKFNKHLKALKKLAKTKKQKKEPKKLQKALKTAQYNARVATIKRFINKYIAAPTKALQRKIAKKIAALKKAFKGKKAKKEAKKLQRSFKQKKSL